MKYGYPLKCLVLGGGGFLGSHLCNALLARGHSIRVFDRPNLRRFRKFDGAEKIEWFEGDFTNRNDVARIIPGCDVVYHLISTTLPKTSNANTIYDISTNLLGTLHLLELVRNSDIRKIVFISSGGTVYGIPHKIPIKESHPTNPICSYGICKLTIEKYLHLYHHLHGLDYCILRLANPFGERQSVFGDQGAIAVFLYKAMMREKIEIWGDGSVVRDYIHVSHAVDAMIKAIEYKDDKHIFNIGSGKGKSLNDVAEEVTKVTGYKVDIIFKDRRPMDVPVNILDVEKAKHSLKWKPEIKFEDELNATYTWMKNSVGIV